MKHRSYLCICILLGGFFVLGVKGAVRQDEQKSMDQIEALLSRDFRTRDRAVDSILRDRSAVINELIPLIDPANSEKYSDETRCASAYLLGEFRAVEAVPVLSKALAEGRSK
jgi:hypothetical protein